MYSLIMGPSDLVGLMRADRFFEHTEDEVTGRFNSDLGAGNFDIEALLELPALLMPETQNSRVHQVARVGRVSALRRMGKYCEYKFIPDQAVKLIPTSIVEEHANAFDIVDPWEFNRTHWAVKDIDLYEVLVKYGLIGAGDSPSRLDESDPSDQGIPTLFIGSSAEGLSVARALQAGLDEELECTVWDQGVFSAGYSSLSDLLSRANSADYAALILSPDDISVTRGVIGESPRDNVIFELGLFMGALSSERVFMLIPREEKTKLPSDLAGITYLHYKSKRSDSNLRAALGPAVTAIMDRARALGRRE